MSKTVRAEGYIDVRIFIKSTYNCSNSASPADIAELAKNSVEEKFNCEILSHKLKIEE